MSWASIFWAVGPLSPYKDLKLNHKISSHLAHKAASHCRCSAFFPLQFSFSPTQLWHHRPTFHSNDQQNGLPMLYTSLQVCSDFVLFPDLADQPPPGSLHFSISSCYTGRRSIRLRYRRVSEAISAIKFFIFTSQCSDTSPYAICTVPYWIQVWWRT